MQHSRALTHLTLDRYATQILYEGNQHAPRRTLRVSISSLTYSQQPLCELCALSTPNNALCGVGLWLRRWVRAFCLSAIPTTRQPQTAHRHKHPQIQPPSPIVSRSVENLVSDAWILLFVHAATHTHMRITARRLRFVFPTPRALRAFHRQLGLSLQVFGLTCIASIAHIYTFRIHCRLLRWQCTQTHSHTRKYIQPNIYNRKTPAHESILQPPITRRCSSSDRHTRTTTRANTAGGSRRRKANNMKYAHTIWFICGAARCVAFALTHINTISCCSRDVDYILCASFCVSGLFRTIYINLSILYICTKEWDERKHTLLRHHSGYIGVVRRRVPTEECMVYSDFIYSSYSIFNIWIFVKNIIL